MQFSRYAIYFTPPPGPFASAGAHWLGWDIASGAPCASVGGALTERPRKYGFHATIKAPFCLADGATSQELAAATGDLARGLSATALQGLSINRLGSFLALTPNGDLDALRALAAQVVRKLDIFRAPLTEAERARKTRPNMDAELRENLELFGYPHVGDRFNFHMTLTGPIAKSQNVDALAKASAHFNGHIPDLLMIDSLTLVGEAPDGNFKQIRRFSIGQTAD